MIKKLLLLGLAGMLVLLFGVILNVVAHEAGHYAVAKAYDLNPEINISGGYVEYDNGNVYFGPTPANASVSYTAPESGSADAAVAFAGPCVNICLFVLFASLYFISKNKSYAYRFMILVLLIPSMLSVAINLAPIAGSDGLAMLAALG